jgi:hypothetical protein
MIKKCVGKKYILYNLYLKEVSTLVFRGSIVINGESQIMKNKKPCELRHTPFGLGNSKFNVLGFSILNDLDNYVLTQIILHKLFCEILTVTERRSQGLGTCVVVCIPPD